jgi:prevent-host-death family protein
MTATELRANLYRVLNQVLKTGSPVEVVLNGKTLRIVPGTNKARWEQLVAHHDCVVGDSDELVELDVSSKWKPFP